MLNFDLMMSPPGVSRLSECLPQEWRVSLSVSLSPRNAASVCVRGRSWCAAPPSTPADTTLPVWPACSGSTARESRSVPSAECRLSVRLSWRPRPDPWMRGVETRWILHTLGDGLCGPVGSMCGYVLMLSKPGGMSAGRDFFFCNPRKFRKETYVTSLQFKCSNVVYGGETLHDERYNLIISIFQHGDHFPFPLG